MSGRGISQDDICIVIGIGSKATLHKYYKPQLAEGQAAARTAMINRWYNNCMAGDHKAQESWLRIFGGTDFKPDAQRLEVTGAEGKPVEITPVPMTAERITEVLQTLQEVLPPGKEDDANA